MSGDLNTLHATMGTKLKVILFSTLELSYEIVLKLLNLFVCVNSDGLVLTRLPLREKATAVLSQNTATCYCGVRPPAAPPETLVKVIY